MPDEPVETTPPEDPRRRERGWLTWLALALLLLVILLLLRDYLGRRGTSAEVGVIKTSSSQIPTRPAERQVELEGASEDTTERPVSGVPDVVGLMTSDALSTLDRAGYIGSVTKIYSDDRPIGVVFEQVPAAGASADPGSTVQILVSDGSQPPASVKLPNLVGLKKATAVDRVESLGLDPKVMVQPRRDGSGRVFQQSPAPGKKVARGSKVFLLVTIPW